MNILVILVLQIIAILLILIIILSMWKRVPADKAAVIIGRKKRVVSGGGTLLVPIIERMNVITLESISLAVNSKGAKTSQGVPINVDAVAIVKVRNTEKDVFMAFEHFHAGKDDLTRKRIEDAAISVLEGKLCEIVGTLTVEKIYIDREAFSNRVREAVEVDLQVMGLKLVSFAIKEISDEKSSLP